MHARLARQTDIQAITRINDYYIARTPANFNTQPVGQAALLQEWQDTHQRYPWVVAADDESAAIGGFAKASPWKGRCAYDWSAEITVYVDPEHQRKGIGALLYTHLFEILRDQGFRTLLGGITQPNEASVRLHEKMGMRKVAHLQRVGWKFGAWHDVAYWQIDLQSDDAAPEPLKTVAQVTNT